MESPIFIEHIYASLFDIVDILAVCQPEADLAALSLPWNLFISSATSNHRIL